MPHSCQVEGGCVPVDIDSVLAEAEAIIAQHQLRLGAKTGCPYCFGMSYFLRGERLNEFL
jgi:hypothetical protein